MKILSGLLYVLLLTGCSNTLVLRNFDTGYLNAQKNISDGNYELAYRELEFYFKYHRSTFETIERQAEIRKLLENTPEILPAALNTFTRESFQKTLIKTGNNKPDARTRELLRILAFKKIYPDKYPEAAKNFTAFFGNTPEYLQAENKKRAATLFANRKDITILQKGKFISVNAKGNLEATKPITCVEINTLSSEYTPADLFTGISDCLKHNDIPRATRLYALALAYGRYDQLRMVDKSSRGAISVLQFNHLSRNSKETQQELKKQILIYSASNKEGTKFKAMCNDIKKLGKPSYTPNYMIKHGMSVFTGGESGVLTGFNENENWDKIYHVFLKCP